MNPQPLDRFAARLRPEVQQSVHLGCAGATQARLNALTRDFEDPEPLRQLAAEIRQHTLDHLDTYLEAAESAMRRRGIAVHFAEDGETARKSILSLLQEHGAQRVCKSKSMASEEIDLNSYLARAGVTVVETDLGEFIIQLDNDHPSHVVRPIAHRNRGDVAATFQKHGLGDWDDRPEIITQRARAYMRSQYLSSDAALTGGNFISAESGRLVLVTNEGNARFSLAGSRLHIALVGIEKIVPRDRDLSVLLGLLARSATGQHLSVYTEFVAGPKAPGQPDGPAAMHVILFDNHRSTVLASSCREILRCIRCGACMNVCPVYRQASGHAYRHVYPGPLGAVLGPLLRDPAAFPEMADLPKASSLCGACQEVCPVDIPIPELLLRLRDRAHREKVPSSGGSLPLREWSHLASHPLAWRAALFAGAAVNLLPPALLPSAALRSWSQHRTLPKWQGGAFRAWFRHRRRPGGAELQALPLEGETLLPGTPV